MSAKASHLPIHTQRPVLCVDLDGSLLATDMLWESMLLAVKSRPSLLLIFPFWLLRGKAYLKRKIAERVKVNAAALPYRSDILSFLVREKKAGRKIVLTTASDMSLVLPIAQHIGVFDDVIASDGRLNLKGTVKQKILEDRYGESSLTIWATARLIWPSGSRQMRRCLLSRPMALSRGRCASLRSNVCFTARSIRCWRW